MNILFTSLLSQSLLLPVMVGLIRLKNLNKSYYPFFMWLMVGAVAELISTVLIHHFKTSNAIVINIYSLLECCLLLLQFEYWKPAGRFNFGFATIITCSVLCWTSENLIFLQINTFSPFFRVLYSFVIVLMSINQVNLIVVRRDRHLFTNPQFIISLVFIIFFTYQIIYEASFFIGSNQSSLADKIITGFSYLNFCINLVYLFAVVLVTKRSVLRQTVIL